MLMIRRGHAFDSEGAHVRLGRLVVVVSRDREQSGWAQIWTGSDMKHDDCFAIAVLGLLG
jgi:hypothetical protein